MNEKIDYEGILSPALIDCKATGQERNPCLLCNQGVKKDERIIELFSSSYKGRRSYTNRFHYKCFLKVLGIKFPELLSDNKFIK